MSRSRATVLEELFKFLLVIISKKGTRRYIYIYLKNDNLIHVYTTVLPILSLKKKSCLLFLKAQTKRVSP